MSMLEKLRAKTPHLAPSSVSIADWNKGIDASPFAKLFGRGQEVEDSEELQRVLALSRRAVIDLDGTPANPGPSARALALTELMTARLRRKDHGTRKCNCHDILKRRGIPEESWQCIDTLLPAQAWVLYEAPLAGGLLGAVGVGHGKTGLDILSPMVMNCKLAVLLVPPNLKQQLVDAYELWAEHFDVPSLVLEGKGRINPGKPVLHVVAYSKFSRPESTNLLEQLAPDLIILDEAHRWRHPDTATTSRGLRYFYNHSECRLCCWSGTLTDKSIKDYAHLAAIALRERSPLPIDPQVVEQWSCAVDPDGQGMPGALRALCMPGETLYKGFGRRLTETQGVVTTRAGAINAAINLHERKAPPLPHALEVMLNTLREANVRPDGEELIDQLEVAKNARQLACGFYYRWRFPRGEPEELILEWFETRKNWHKELREKLRARQEHLDSEQLCRNAAVRFYAEQETGVRHSKGGHRDGTPPLPVWESDWWPAWRDIADRVYHETEAVWVDDFLALDAAAWAKQHKGVVWYEHEAFGRRVAELSGLPMYGGGDEAATALVRETGKRSVVVSMQAHGTGRDGMQHIWREQLVANPRSSATAWEQLLGRLHRIGQRADEVDTYVYRHTQEMQDAIDKAVVRAKYIEGTMTTSQKLLVANCTFSLDRS
jgi:hypothetical protein